MAQSDPHTLAGMKKVVVLVKSSGPGLPGLTEEMITTDVEQSLSKWGITSGSDQHALFSISFTVAPEVGAYFISINVWQLVQTVRDPMVRAVIVTWSTSDTVTNVKANTITVQIVRDAVQKAVSQFEQAWWGENLTDNVASQ